MASFVAVASFWQSGGFRFSEEEESGHYRSSARTMRWSGSNGKASRCGTFGSTNLSSANSVPAVQLTGCRGVDSVRVGFGRVGGQVTLSGMGEGGG